MSVQLCVCLCVCAKPEKLVIRNCQCKYMLWRTIEVKYWWYLTLIFDLDHSPWSAINGNVQGLYYPLGSVMTEWLLHCRCAWSEDGRTEVWRRRHVCWHCCTAGVHEVKMVGLKCDVDVMCVETVALQVCMKWRWSVWSVTSTSCVLTLLYCRCTWSEDGRSEVWQQHHVCWHCCTAGVHEVKMVGLKCDVDVMCVDTVALQVCMRWRWSVWSVTSTSCVLTLKKESGDVHMCQKLPVSLFQSFLQNVNCHHHDHHYHVCLLTSWHNLKIKIYNKWSRAKYKKLYIHTYIQNIKGRLYQSYLVSIHAWHHFSNIHILIVNLVTGIWYDEHVVNVHPKAVI